MVLYPWMYRVLGLMCLVMFYEGLWLHTNLVVGLGVIGVLVCAWMDRGAENYYRR